ncbi:MAG: LysM peptidoglycan-binding domain-containing protein, partial [Alphaproteobacteria bacterium GM202ARS2]|nr:LysM peptidoglycan-binding domain-containing protein [Alphaproteobacteria bacterium GM202ARS2]
MTSKTLGRRTGDLSRGGLVGLCVLVLAWSVAGCEQLIYGEEAYLEELSHEDLIEGMFRDGDEGEGEGEEEGVDYWQENDTDTDTEMAYGMQEDSRSAGKEFVVPAIEGPGESSSEGSRIRVEKGDTLYSLSRRHGVKVADLAAWNGIAPPYVIKPGQTLRLAQGRKGRVASGGRGKGKVHTVRKGETAYGIARSHGVTIADLIAANDLSDASKLAVGQALRVGGNVEGRVGGGESQPQRMRKKGGQK